MLIRNTAANLAGQLLYPILGVALVPFYLRHLGLEGYGMIGLMTLVASLLSIFTRGMGAALQREIARRHGADDADTLPRLLRSMEVLYWTAGCVIGVLLCAAAVTVAPRWITTQQLTPEALKRCLVLLAIRVSVAFPLTVYQSVFVGTQRQVLGSALNAAHALTAAAAAAGAVLLFESVAAFYAAEAAVAAVFSLIFRACAFHVLPARSARFSAGEIRRQFGISLALMWTSGTGLLLSSLDRVAVGAILPVSALGLYSIASMGGRLVTLFIQPFLQAVYPRTCHLARVGTPDEQAEDVLRNTAVLVVVVAAVGLPLGVFAPEALAIWIADPAVVTTGAPVMASYVVASLLIAFASVLYQWQTATGRTSVAVRFNALAVLWFPPLLWGLLSRAGLFGASLAWATYGALAWLTNVTATFGAGKGGRPLLHAYLRQIVIPLGPALLLTLGARYIASSWFVEHLTARAALGVLAGASGGGVALAIVWPRLRHSRPLPASAPLDVQPGSDKQLVRFPIV